MDTTATAESTSTTTGRHCRHCGQPVRHTLTWVHGPDGKQDCQPCGSPTASPRHGPTSPVARLPLPALPRTPREAAAALKALDAALRDYVATFTPRGDGTYNFEVTRTNDNAPGPACLISRNPGEILDRLTKSTPASHGQDA
jgi:hypothetical protein